VISLARGSILERCAHARDHHSTIGGTAVPHTAAQRRPTTADVSLSKRIPKTPNEKTSPQNPHRTMPPTVPMLGLTWLGSSRDPCPCGGKLSAKLRPPEFIDLASFLPAPPSSLDTAPVAAQLPAPHILIVAISSGYHLQRQFPCLGLVLLRLSQSAEELSCASLTAKGTCLLRFAVYSPPPPRTQNI
jgi:hypothetical protein